MAVCTFMVHSGELIIFLTAAGSSVSTAQWTSWETECEVEGLSKYVAATSDECEGPDLRCCNVKDDDVLWKDKDGNDCSVWSASPQWCVDKDFPPANYANNAGVDATTACCVCGGGSNINNGDQTLTDSSTCTYKGMHMCIQYDLPVYAVS